MKQRNDIMRSLLDKLLAACGLILLSPLLLVIAVAIVVEDGFPVLFRQIRVGRDGKEFTLLKFRSMRVANAGSGVTAAGDNRITRPGRILRRYKLDEIPQLFNILVGEMSIVGPRPEIPKFVDRSSPVWQDVLSVRPGLTDIATLQYRHEEELLAAATDVEAYYRSVILPDKLSLNQKYLASRSLWRDLKIIIITIQYSLRPNGVSTNTLKQL